MINLPKVVQKQLSANAAIVEQFLLQTSKHLVRHFHYLQKEIPSKLAKCLLRRLEI